MARGFMAGRVDRSKRTASAFASMGCQEGAAPAQSSLGDSMTNERRLRAAWSVLAGAIFGLSVCMSVPARSDPTDPPITPAERAEADRLIGIIKSENRQYGDVFLPDAKVTLHLGKAYYFLGKDDARRAIVDGWKNPASAADGVLGMIIPEGKVFANSWGAVVSYESAGFVTDKDADKASYDKMLRQVQDGEADVNAQRQKDGFPTMHLVGWAQPPSYNHQSHYLIWARDLKFSGSDSDALNYDVRMLGRHGVLSVNLVSSMPDLPQVRTDAANLAKTITYQPGFRYEEYNPSTDKKAAYGVGGLVAAGLGLVVAKKLGLLAIGLVFFKKAAVLIIAGFAALANWLRRLFGLKKSPRKRASASGPVQLESISEPAPKADQT